MNRLFRTVAAAFGLVVITAAAASACPNWRLDPAFGQVQLSAGFLPDPHRAQIIAGGRQSIQQCTGQAFAGFVASPPDYRIIWSGQSQQLTLIVDAPQGYDTVLLINDPRGQWLFNDDVSQNDLRSGIQIFNPAEGQYDIWIGQYGAEQGTAQTTLLVTER